jgi:superfamily II DNA/RNA helicase
MTPEEKKERKRLYDIEYRKKNAEKIKERQAIYREENPEKKKQRNKEYYQKNKDRKKEYDAEYRVKNLEKRKQKDKEYYQKNAEKIKERQAIYSKENKDKINNHQKNRKKTDPIYRLTCNLRCSIKASFKRKGLDKLTKTELILGCSFKSFKEHIESKFESWMNWDNYGLYNGEFNYGWDIDHIIPLSSATTEDEVIRLNHYTNLQPLCSKVNRHIKGG